MRYYSSHDTVDRPRSSCTQYSKTYGVDKIWTTITVLIMCLHKDISSLIINLLRDIYTASSWTAQNTIQGKPGAKTPHASPSQVPQHELVFPWAHTGRRHGADKCWLHWTYCWYSEPHWSSSKLTCWVTPSQQGPNTTRLRGTEKSIGPGCWGSLGNGPVETRQNKKRQNE